jgi:hypothetical protein
MIVMSAKTSNSSNIYFYIFFRYAHDFVFKKCLNAIFMRDMMNRERSILFIDEIVEMLNVFKLLRIFFIARLLTLSMRAMDLRISSTRK